MIYQTLYERVDLTNLAKVILFYGIPAFLGFTYGWTIGGYIYEKMKTVEDPRLKLYQQVTTGITYTTAMVSLVSLLYQVIR